MLDAVSGTLFDKDDMWSRHLRIMDSGACLHAVPFAWKLAEMQTVVSTSALIVIDRGEGIDAI